MKFSSFVMGDSPAQRKNKVIDILMDAYKLSKSEAQAYVKRQWTEAVKHVKEEDSKGFREASQDGVLDDWWNENLDAIADAIHSLQMGEEEHAKTVSGLKTEKVTLDHWKIMDGKTHVGDAKRKPGGAMSGWVISNLKGKTTEIPHWAAVLNWIHKKENRGFFK